MKTFTNRRGALLADSLDWVIALICTFFVLLMIVFITNSFQHKEVDTSELDPYIYLAKIHYSPHIMYATEPSTETPFTGVIDLEKFSSYPGGGQTHSFEENNFYAADFVGAELTLLYENLDPVKSIVNPVYNNQKLFEELEGFALQGVRGAGGASYKEFLIPVTFTEKNKLQRGYMRIKIVRPNS